jgi:hypothetical protein
MPLRGAPSAIGRWNAPDQNLTGQRGFEQALRVVLDLAQHVVMDRRAAAAARQRELPAAADRECGFDHGGGGFVARAFQAVFGKR